MEGLKLKEADFVMGLETENSLEWPEYLHFFLIFFSPACVPPPPPPAYLDLDFK